MLVVVSSSPTVTSEKYSKTLGEEGEGRREIRLISP